MKSALIIGNPASGRAAKDKLALAARVLESQGVKTVIRLTSKRGDAEAFAREAVKNAPDAVIAAGGDGTMNEVANGLALSGVTAGFLPLGTVNVLASELGIPRDIEAAAMNIASSAPKELTLGRISFEGKNRYFVLMAGAGFDAAAVYNVSLGIKKFSGRFAYIQSAVKTLMTWNPDSLTVTANGSVYTASSVIACNAAWYGGPLVIAPGADMSSPELKVLIMRGMGRLDVIRYSLGLLAGRLYKMKDVEYITTSELKIEGSSHIQLDGDFAGMTPATIEAVPKALKLIY